MGLGNPGKQYAQSRHNVGFLVVESFTRAQGFPAQRMKLNVRYSEKRMAGEPVYALLPQTFMNLSGPAVRAFLDYFGRPGADGGLDLGGDLLVVHDDIDLPAGKLRFRKDGSSGGHRGVQSIIDACGSGAFSRLKVGVGRAKGTQAADYVLESLGGDEHNELLRVSEEAAKTLPLWLREGTAACANRFNGACGELKKDGKADGDQRRESEHKDQEDR